MDKLTKEIIDSFRDGGISPELYEALHYIDSENLECMRVVIQAIIEWRKNNNVSRETYCSTVVKQ